MARRSSPRTPRNPDIRWRAQPEDLARHAAKQRVLLDALAPLVRDGGGLVYSVCSLAPEEGVDVVQGFLASHRDFHAVGGPDWSRAFASGPYYSTGPETHGGDGFFVAVLERG